MFDTAMEARRERFVGSLRKRILPLRKRAEIRNAWLQDRLDRLLPEIMAREGFDMWIVAAREYNEDPVIMTLLPEPAMAARRRTVLIFSRQPDGSVERVTFDRYGFGAFYERGWDPDEGEQDAAIAAYVQKQDPQSIGINVSETFAFGDGLTHQEFEALERTLGPRYADRTASAERLCVGWLERRTPLELAIYPALIEIAHAIIAEMYSRNTIVPGLTTTEDVVWWLRQTILDAGLQAWFQPTVDIQAPGKRFDDREEQRTLIVPGDVLHCDVGFVYLGLATDHQQHAYILRPGESAPPPGLFEALRAGNRLQEIHCEEMQVGRTGNGVLHAALKRAKAEGLLPSIYSHPLGYHGHAAGPTIGLWDQQEGVPGRGDYPLYNDTCYSIELNIRYPVPEWGGQEVRIALEEDAVLTGGLCSWLAGRQIEWFVI